MSHLIVNGVDKTLDHIRLNNVRSENLFNATWNSGSIGANGGMIADTNAVRTTAIPCSAEKTYTFVPDIDDCDSIWVNYYGTTNTRERIDTIGGTFTTPQGCEQIRFRVTKSNIGVTPVQQYNAMLNEGSTAKPYEPYLITKEAWEARTRVILHNLTNPLCGIGTYKDTLDLSTGTLTRYIKKLVLTGKENWTSETGDVYYALSISPNLIDRNDLLSTHFFVGNYSGALEIGQLRGGGTPSANIVFNYDNGTIGIEGFKAYLAAQYSAGTPVVIWYVLATPETETITVPSNLTGIVEGYLTQSSTPSPTSPVYPTANGTLEQGGTYSLDTGAYAIAWGRADTFTGTDSMSARCYGLPIKSWEIDGNSQQDGTPSPDAPIMPELVGEKTENLFDYQTMADGETNCYIDNTGNIITQGGWSITKYIHVNGKIFSLYRTATGNTPAIALYDSNKQFVVAKQYNGNSRLTISSETNISFVRFSYQTYEGSPEKLSAAMLVLGSSIPLNYIPYGYKIPITNAGQTMPIYLGQTQTVRRIKKLVLTGEETNWIYEGEYERFGIPVYDMFVRGTRLVTLICSHYQCIDDGRTIGNVPNNSIYVVGGLTNMIFIKTNSYTTVDAFKNYLQEQYTNGTPVTIWYVLAKPETAIVNEPLAKIGNYVDTLTSEQAGITIPTTDGNNIISVDTTLAPSKMTITGHIRDVWFEQSITGVPPLSFKSNGKPLISWSMLGNGQQTGTPTPDAPIMPTFCGDRTGNLAPPLAEWIDGYVAADGTIQPPDETAQQKSSGYLSVAAGETYTFSIENGFLPGESVPWRAIVWYAQDKTFISRESDNVSDALSTIAPLNAAYCRLSYRTYGEKTNPIFNSGSTPFPYEPYGYKIPITCAGQTQNVYLGEVQTVRRVKRLVLTGEEDWDTGTVGTNRFFYTYRQNAASIYASILSSHYIPSNVPGAQRPNNSIRQTASATAAVINIRDDACTTLADFKQFLAAQYAAGTPVTVWYVLAEPETGIVNEPLAKIGTYADTLTSEQAGITIPTTDGNNIISVDTSLAPSEMTITGYIKQE